MLEIGSLVDGKYKILNKIGQGGMSVVYLAMNEKANKQWAIKEVRKDGKKDFDVIRQGLVVETDMLKSAFAEYSRCYRWRWYLPYSYGLYRR